MADIPPATIGIPKYITQSEWSDLLERCTLFNVNPYLIAAIGWHETHWGKLGAGRSGYILGVGVLSDTNVQIQFKGLEKQLDWAVPRLGKAFGLHPTATQIVDFAHNVWCPGNPDAWANSTWKILQETLSTYSPGFSTFSDVPNWAREPVAAMLRLRFLTTPFGSDDFYRSVTIIFSVYNDLHGQKSVQKE